MKTNKIYLLILTITLLGLTSSAFGQSQNSRDIIGNINANLERTCAEIEENIASLDDSIKLADVEIKYLNEEIDILDKEYKSIEAQLSKTRRLQTAINTCSKVNNRIKQDVDKLQGKLETKNDDVANLERVAKADGEKYVKLALDVDTKPFSTISCAEIDQVKKYLDYFCELECCKEYAPKFKTFEELYNLYLEANQALHEEHNSAEINSVRAKIIPYLNEYDRANAGGVKSMTKEQFKELDELDATLSYYDAINVDNLYKIVDAINNDPQIKKFREAEDVDKCIERMKLYCVKNRGNQSVYEDIEVVPYLHNLLNQYWEELQKNPLVNTEAEAKIIKLWELWNKEN